MFKKFSVPKVDVSFKVESCLKCMSFRVICFVTDVTVRFVTADHHTALPRDTTGDLWAPRSSAADDGHGLRPSCG